MSIRSTTSRLGALGAALALALGLAACGDATASGGTTTSDANTSATEADHITVSDAWVKAVSDGDMTAAFGELSNDSDAEVTIVSASTDAASMMELHETVPNDTGEMTMREIDGGFVIPAGGTFTLEPGGNHLMLMGLKSDIAAGDDVSITLTFADDSTLEVTAPAKDYSGANENYEDDDSMGDMDHDDHDHGDDADH